MFCRMMFGGICCRALKNIVVVEDGLKIGGEEGSGLEYSDSSFEGNINGIFEGKRTMSEIIYRNR